MPTESKCIHCGDSCGKYPVMYDGKPFCCNGCSTVYQLLNTSDMDQYYHIEPMSGIKMETDQLPANEKYAYLDLEAIQEKIIDFSEVGISKVRFFIPVIHCASCIWLLENLHKLHKGIVQSQVNFPKKEVHITYRDEEISLRQVVELLASIHYIPEINERNKDENPERKSNQRQLIKIGIAGFSFMNAMLYHFPNYLPGGEYLETDFRTLFTWLSFLLALPVTFYCANDYFLSAWKSLRKRIVSIDLPIAIGLITLFLQSSYEIFSGKGIGFFDSLTGLVFFLLIGKWYQGKTYQALSFERDYKTYFPVAVTTLIEGKQQIIPLAELKAGNRILVRNREIIPADSRIEKGNANIDYSFVSGESIPVSKDAGDFVYAGGRQVGGAIELLVEKEVEQSYLTRLWNESTKKSEAAASSLRTVVDRVSQYFTLTILVIALAAAAYWLSADFNKALFAFTSVLIIACPCALALTIPFTFGSTMRQFGRRGFYIKNTSVIEQLYKTDTIVFDKTGTITHAHSSHINFDGGQLTETERKMIFSLARHSIHPLSKSLANYLFSEETFEVDNFRELTGLGASGNVTGQRINIGSRYFVTGQKGSETELKTRVWISIDGQTKGSFRFENKYRDGFESLVKELDLFYDLHLLSGDNESEQKRLAEVFSQNDQLKFNQSPTDKLEYIRKLKSKGKHVLMIGDGLNDAGALSESNTGIVIADDVYNFSPACDAILQSGKFSELAKLILFTRKSMNIVRISFLISFLYNVVGISIAVSGSLSPVIAAVLMPLSSISVVAFASFAVGLAARYAKL